MNNAPSVSYPVGRCAFQRWVYVVLCAISIAVLAVWAWLQPTGWVWGLAVVCWLVASAVGGRACWRDLGQLTWTGQVWYLQTANHETSGAVSVSIDVQGALLLKWTPLFHESQRATAWLWLGAENSPKLWQDLRRAVFASVQTG